MYFQSFWCKRSLIRRLSSNMSLFLYTNITLGQEMHIRTKSLESSFMLIGSWFEKNSWESVRIRISSAGLSRPPQTITQVAKTLFAPKVPFIFLKEQFRSFPSFINCFLPTSFSEYFETQSQLGDVATKMETNSWLFRKMGVTKFVFTS